MGAIVSQITSLTIIFSTVYLDTAQRKHQSSASLAFVWGIHRWPVNSPHKWPVTRKMFPFDDVIMEPVISQLTDNASPSLNELPFTSIQSFYAKFTWIFTKIAIFSKIKVIEICCLPNGSHSVQTSVYQALLKIHISIHFALVWNGNFLLLIDHHLGAGGGVNEKTRCSWCVFIFSKTTWVDAYAITCTEVMDAGKWQGWSEGGKMRMKKKKKKKGGEIENCAYNAWVIMLIIEISTASHAVLIV